MIEILYRDDDFCVINKPANSVVYKTPGAEKSLVLLQTLRDQLGQKVFPVHRLDNGTSGCLAFALSSEAAAEVQRALGEQESKKVYLTLLRGHPADEGVIDRPLTGEKGVKQEAITYYKVLKRYKDVSLVEVEIKTGRKHQIRRHMAFEGHQIIGDVNHGKGWLNRHYRENFNFYRMFLHCHHLELFFKSKNKTIQINCPLPEDLNVLLNTLPPCTT